MRCLICSGEYINLGVHIQKKHMPCHEYRIKFDIKLSTPLVDKSLSEMLSVSALQRFENPEWLAACQKNCVENFKKEKHHRVAPPASKKHLVDMNRRTGESYRSKMIPAIMKDYLSGMTPTEIQKKHRVSPTTLNDWQVLGLLPKRKFQYVYVYEDDKRLQQKEEAKC